MFQICKIAEKNPEVEFLQVNYEEQRSLCQSLHVHVLPFFRFYRGSSGRVCSFSCTNATVIFYFYSFFSSLYKLYEIDCLFMFAFTSMLVVTIYTVFLKIFRQLFFFSNYNPTTNSSISNTNCVFWFFEQINKFKEALEKHGREQCSIGKTKGLEEKELVAMATNKDLSLDYKPKNNEVNREIKENDTIIERSPTSKEHDEKRSLVISPAGIV